MRQFFAFLRDHIWPAAWIAAAALVWGYGVVSDAGEIAALVLNPMEWQLIGGLGILTGIAALLFQFYKSRIAVPSVQPALSPAPSVSIISHHQRGGITAQTVNVGHRPRSIAHRAARYFRQYLLTSLSKDEPWDVVSLLGDAEAFGFASEIHQFMVDNGFKMKQPRSYQVVCERPVRDVIIEHEIKRIIVGTNSGLRRD
jgi:hypothetical protein